MHGHMLAPNSALVPADHMALGLAAIGTQSTMTPEHAQMRSEIIKQAMVG